jgi:hypothetical protein
MFAGARSGKLPTLCTPDRPFVAYPPWIRLEDLD